MSFAERLRGVRLHNPGLLWDEDAGYRIADDGQIVKTGGLFFDEPTGYRIDDDGQIVEIGSVWNTPTGYRINDKGKLIRIGQIFDNDTGKRIGLDGALYESGLLFEKRSPWPGGESPDGDTGGSDRDGGGSEGAAELAGDRTDADAREGDDFTSDANDSDDGSTDADEDRDDDKERRTLVRKFLDSAERDLASGNLASALEAAKQAARIVENVKSKWLYFDLKDWVLYTLAKVYKAAGDQSGYVAQLRKRIRLTGQQSEAKGEFDALLEEIAALPQPARTSLLVAYVEGAKNWRFLPASLATLSEDSYRTAVRGVTGFIACHVGRLRRGEVGSNADIHLRTLFAIAPVFDDSGPLGSDGAELAAFMEGLPKHTIEYLLMSGQEALAAQAFASGLARNKDAWMRSDPADFHALGEEFRLRGFNKTEWMTGFADTLGTGPAALARVPLLAWCMKTPALRDQTRERLRSAAFGRLKLALSQRRKDRAKALRKDESGEESKIRVLVALPIAAFSGYLLWQSDGILAVILGIGLYFAVAAAGAKVLKTFNADVQAFKEADASVAEIAAVTGRTPSQTAKDLGSEPPVGLFTRSMFAFLACTLLVAGVIGISKSLQASEDGRRGLDSAGESWKRDWVAHVDTGNRWTSSTMTARLGLDESKAPMVALHERSFFGSVSSSPRSVVRLAQCVGSHSNVSCSGTLSIDGAPKFQSIRSRLDLDITRGAGTLTTYPPDEPPFVVRLEGTPSSIDDRPKWVSMGSPAGAALPYSAAIARPTRSDVASTAPDALAAAVTAGSSTAAARRAPDGLVSSTAEALPTTPPVASGRAEGQSREPAIAGSQADARPSVPDVASRPPDVRSHEIQAVAPTTGLPASGVVIMARDPNTGCQVWKPSLTPNEAVTWSGPCVNGFAEGTGTASWTVDGRLALTYEGRFRSGVLQGVGRMIGAGGDRFEGAYRDGKREGYGVYASATGERYEGEFKGNRRHGRGTLIHADGSRVEGTFVDGNPPADGKPLRASGDR